MCYTFSVQEFFMLTFQRLFFFVDTIICVFLVLGILFVWFSKEEHETFAVMLIVLGIPWLSVEPYVASPASMKSRDSPLHM